MREDTEGIIIDSAGLLFFLKTFSVYNKKGNNKVNRLNGINAQPLGSSQLALEANFEQIRKDYGIFFTPERIVDFMVGLIDAQEYVGRNKVNILEPACGLAQFLSGIKRMHPSLFRKASLSGVEINYEIIRRLKSLRIADEINLIHQDYLLWQSEPVFDLIIGNPPYGIPSLSSHYTIKIPPETKERYKKLFQTWYGKYNVYGAFIEKSVKLLKPEGRLILIVPATFMILDEFKKLREFLAKNGRSQLIYLGPDVFKPEAEVASLVLDFRKSKQLAHNLKLLEYQGGKTFPIKVEHRWDGEVVKFETEYSRALENHCSYLLQDLFEIRISPRTPEIKNSSLVLKTKPKHSSGYLPLLNGRNLKCNQIFYENLSGYWIKKTDLHRFRGWFGKPHIVVGLGFRENGKVAAGLDDRCYPWMGDIYHLFEKEGLFNTGYDLSKSELLEYLNSEYIRRYVKDAFREITYHLSITQLKHLPVPTKREWEEIKRNFI